MHLLGRAGIRAILAMELKSKGGIQTLVESLKTSDSEPWRSTKLRQNVNQLESYLPERKVKGVFIQPLIKTKEGAGRHSHEINVFANTRIFLKRNNLFISTQSGNSLLPMRRRLTKSPKFLWWDPSKEARRVKERRLISGPELLEITSCNNYRIVENVSKCALC